MSEKNVHISSRSILPDRVRRVSNLIDGMHTVIHGPCFDPETWTMLELDAKEIAAMAFNVAAELKRLLAPK